MKFISGIFLIIGSTVGGGILGLPLAAANLGFLGSLLAVVIIWLIMTATGLCVLRISYKLPIEHNTYFTLSAKYLKFNGARVTVFGSYLLILYLTLAAYISGVGSAVSSYFLHNSELTHLLSAGFLIIVLGTWVVYKPKVIINNNIIFVLAKLSLIVLAIIFIFSYSHSMVVNIDSSPFITVGSLSFMLVVFNAFGYHFIIPSIVKYYKKSFSFKGLAILLVISTSIIAILYMIWLVAIFLTIPMYGEHGMLSIFKSHDQVLAFNRSMYLFTNSLVVSNVLNAFQFVSMIGSFCCISIGLMDNLKDALGQESYFKVMLCTYLPPVVLTCISENVFLLAMSIAGILALYVEVFVPIISFKNYKAVSLRN